MVHTRYHTGWAPWVPSVISHTWTRLNRFAYSLLAERNRLVRLPAFGDIAEELFIFPVEFWFLLCLLSPHLRNKWWNVLEEIWYSRQFEPEFVCMTKTSNVYGDFNDTLEQKNELIGRLDTFYQNEFAPIFQRLNQ